MLYNKHDVSNLSLITTPLTLHRMDFSENRGFTLHKPQSSVLHTEFVFEEKLWQENHPIIVTISFSKIFAYKIFPLHTRWQRRLFQISRI